MAMEIIEGGHQLGIQPIVPSCPHFPLGVIADGLSYTDFEVVILKNAHLEFYFIII